MKRSKTLKLILATLATVIAFAVVPSDSYAAGWGQEEDGRWYYEYEDGTRYKNQWVYDGAWYYFGEDNYMVTGLQTIQTHTYYFCEADHGSWKKGRMMYGWQFINGKYMYFDTNGYYHEEIKGDQNTIKGIDVSQYQGKMDWSKVKNQGISFAFIRVGHGDHNVDPYFVSNIDNANNVGIKCGVYFYSTAQTEEDSRSDALWVIDQLKGHTVSYPVAIDLESSSQTSLGKDTITAIAKAFCDEIAEAGYTPMVYCNENWAKSYIDFTQLNGVYKWIARYNGTYNTDYKRDIWQAGSTTFLDGITVNSVDIDFGFTDFSAIVTPRTERVPVAAKTDVPEVGENVIKGDWMASSSGWWFKKSDGSYPASEWVTIDNVLYYFNASGYLANGWVAKDKDWYYMTSNGLKKSAWITSGGSWYYLKSDGKMASGEWRDGYWLSESGAWTYKYIGTWKHNNTGWWFEDSSGWYPVNQWQLINDKWYYFGSNGYMLSNTTINGYKLGEDGAMVEETEEKKTEETKAEETKTEDIAEKKED